MEEIAAIITAFVDTLKFPDEQTKSEYSKEMIASFQDNLLENALHTLPEDKRAEAEAKIDGAASDDKFIEEMNNLFKSLQPEQQRKILNQAIEKVLSDAVVEAIQSGKATAADFANIQNKIQSLLTNLQRVKSVLADADKGNVPASDQLEKLSQI